MIGASSDRGQGVDVDAARRRPRSASSRRRSAVCACPRRTIRSWKRSRSSGKLSPSRITIRSSLLVAADLAEGDPDERRHLLARVGRQRRGRDERLELVHHPAAPLHRRLEQGLLAREVLVEPAAPGIARPPPRSRRPSAAVAAPAEELDRGVEDALARGGGPLGNQAITEVNARTAFRARRRRSSRTCRRVTPRYRQPIVRRIACPWR